LAGPRFRQGTVLSAVISGEVSANPAGMSKCVAEAVADPTRDCDDGEIPQSGRLGHRCQLAHVRGQGVPRVLHVARPPATQVDGHHPARGQGLDQPGILSGQLTESRHHEHRPAGGVVPAALHIMQSYIAVRRPSAAYGLMGYGCRPHERFGSRGSLSSRSAMTSRPISEVPPAMLRHRSKRYSKTISGSPSLTAASPAIRSPSSETR